MSQLIGAIQAHALLHRDQRKRSEPNHWIIATIADDYAAVRELMSDVLDINAEVKMRSTMPQTIAAVKAAQPNDDERGASVNDIAKKLKLDKSTTRRRLYAALDEGLLVNMEERRGRPAQYRLSGQAQRSSETPHEPILPDVASVKKAYQQWHTNRKQKAESGQQVLSVSPSESRARVHAQGSSR